MLAVVKPAGVLAHPAAEGDRPALTALLPQGVQPLHRLDVGTSGVVLCSGDPAAAQRVRAWLAEGAVEKHYLALVHGLVRPKGVIRRGLKDARRRKTLDAVTRYTRREALGGFSLLHLRPETGRKHQIRRHLQGLGHPVVGDTRYRPRRFVRVPAFPGRLWLHAWRVVLPGGAAFEAPLPEALEAHLVVLREGLSGA